jgi:hypothetical protein
MLTPIKTDFDLNLSHLYKSEAASKMKELLSFTQKDRKMIRTASNGQDDIITLFSQMLKCLNMNANSNVQDVMQKLVANSDENIKSASAKSESRSAEIKIASKMIKDSHYEVDISKDVVTQNNQKVYMVSCYMKEGYLGRYIVKRNYFYTMDREAAADNTYDELILKMGSLKDRYYNEIIKVSAITTQAKTILDGVISEIEMNEDSLGTTVNRRPYENNSQR